MIRDRLAATAQRQQVIEETPDDRLLIDGAAGVYVWQARQGGAWVTQGAAAWLPDALGFETLCGGLHDDVARWFPAAAYVVDYCAANYRGERFGSTVPEAPDHENRQPCPVLDDARPRRARLVL